jgi:nucleotide sugar dehydrogenase
VLENSYRALNIEFIQEWTEFAETAKINLFKVIEGVRKRQTHKNMMLPGFGVGGYCLTKDSLLADWSRRKIFGSAKRMKMSMDAVSINEKMPLHSFNLLKANLGKLKNRRLLIMGVSYRKDVADTRSSPTAVFYKKSLREGANVSLYDPMVDYWSEFDIPVLNDLSRIGRKKADVVVFAVDHDRCLKMSPNTIAGFLRPRGMILDCNNVISDAKADVLRKMGFKLVGVGKGHWNKV